VVELLIANFDQLTVLNKIERTMSSWLDVSTTDPMRQPRFAEPHLSNSIVKKLLLCTFVTALFAKLFLIPAILPPHPKTTWPIVYNLFHVPAFPYPGADARNIQIVAYCAKQGYPYYGQNACLDAAAPAKAIYPEAYSPVLNYPAIWPMLYGLFDNYSETFFMRFWLLNASLLAAAFVVLSVKYDYRALPLFLFSPISLLAIERGNIDASTFFFTFVPLIAFSSARSVQSFFIGIASALKLFPIFGYVAFIRRRPPFLSKEVIFGAASAIPMIILAFWNIGAMLAGTARGFSLSYGLTSLLNAPAFVDHRLTGQLIIALFVALFIAAMVTFLKRHRFRKLLRHALDPLEQTDLIVLLVSASIFLLTFFLFTNWAYRLIFVAPVFFVLSSTSSPFTDLVKAGLLVLFWIPIIPLGWTASNLLCYPLVLLVGIVAIGTWDVLCLRDEDQPVGLIGNVSAQARSA
jgi:hypothetical protein